MLTFILAVIGIGIAVPMLIENYSLTKEVDQLRDMMINHVCKVHVKSHGKKK